MPLTTLFVDFNAYFASVEQQLRPHLRGRPVGVIPTPGDSACCIAATYEAKAHGVKTGTRAAEARRLCPGITLVPARPTVYIQFHERIIEAITTVIPVRGVHSIDEMSCRLAPNERDPERAAALAGRVKAAVREQIGEFVRCSIGLAPNRFLAKVATDMQKPDGLVTILDGDLPAKLLPLELTDLPGIAGRMRDRLAKSGITTVAELYARSERDLARAWGSVVGRRWWHWLRGHDLREEPTKKRSIGHQHVLPPDLRTEEAARGVAVRLLHKAAARARHVGYWPERMSLSVEVAGTRDEKPGWGGGRRGAWGACADVTGCWDTLALVGVLADMWRSRPPGRPVWVDVTLHELTNEASRTLPLFPQEQKRVALSRAIDRLNGRHGRHTLYAGSMHESKETAPGGIAFASVPDLTLVDRVGREDEALEAAA